MHPRIAYACGLFGVGVTLIACSITRYLHTIDIITMLANVQLPYKFHREVGILGGGETPLLLSGIGFFLILWAAVILYPLTRDRFSSVADATNVRTLASLISIAVAPRLLLLSSLVIVCVSFGPVFTDFLGGASPRSIPGPTHAMLTSSWFLKTHAVWVVPAIVAADTLIGWHLTQYSSPACRVRWLQVGLWILGLCGLYTFWGFYAIFFKFRMTVLISPGE